MKQNKKPLVILTLILGILLVPSILYNYNKECYITKPKASTSHASININGNTELDTFFSGDGTDGLTWSTAHIMSNLEIDVTGTESCIFIRNTDRYLIIQACTLTNASFGWTAGGVYLSNCENIRITGCTMIDCGSGIIIRDNSLNITCTGNTMNSNLVGMLVQSSTYIVITNNIITNSDPYSGIEIYDTSNSLISDNTVSNNVLGIAIMDNSDYNTISKNKVSNNDEYGIYLDTDTNNNEVFQNCVENNPSGNIQDDGTNNNLHDNNCPGIPGYSIIIVIGALLGNSIIVLIGIRKKVRT